MTYWLKIYRHKFIKLKNHLSEKKVTYSLICLKSLCDGNLSSIKPIKVLN